MMFHLGGFIVFLGAVGITAAYVAILRHFLRQDEQQAEQDRETSAAAPGKAAPENKERQRERNRSRKQAVEIT